MLYWIRDCGTYLYVRKYLIVIRARFSFLNIVLLLQKVIKSNQIIYKQKKSLNPWFYWIWSDFFKWTWRESNPRPKAHPSKHLPSQSLYWHSLRQLPNDRLLILVASSILPLPQSFGSEVLRLNEAGDLSSGLPKADCRLIKQRTLILYCLRLYLIGTFNVVSRYGWLLQLPDLRRNQYKPSCALLYPWLQTVEFWYHWLNGYLPYWSSAEVLS